MSVYDLSIGQINRRRRTEILLAHFEGLDDEFAMLKGVLCANHNQPPDLGFVENFDLRMIAIRLDAMNAAAMADFRTMCTRSILFGDPMSRVQCPKGQEG